MTPPAKTLIAADGKKFPYTSLRLLILQPTSLCNINCSYCYLPHRTVAKRMSLKTVDAIFDELLEVPFIGNKFTAVWHGGEPLAANIEFYEHAIESSKRLQQRNCVVSHAFQTNATLINDAWCKLFTNARASVGVSLDGPQNIHDRNRRTRSGHGTFDRTLRGINYLRKHDIKFHVICVLTRFSLDFAHEMFELFRQIDTRCVCFNIDEVEGINVDSSMSANDAPQAYGKFLAEFSDLACAVGMEVREYKQLRDLVHSGVFLDTNGLSMPFSTLSVAANGSFSTFAPELLTMTHASYGDFLFGNVHEGGFMPMLDSEKFRRIYAEIQKGIHMCRSECQYFPLCGGGSPSNKVFENGMFASTTTTFCRFSKQLVIDTLLPKIENELATEALRLNREASIGQID